MALVLEGPGGSVACHALNTVQHHDMHHRFPRNHFSLYFTHWDRWMGTLHPKYEADLFCYFGAGAGAEGCTGAGVGGGEDDGGKKVD